MSHFRAFVGQIVDPGILQRPDDLRRFLDGLAGAHEADVQTALAQGSPARRRGTGLSLKDLKPDPFESNDKSRRSFKQWSDEFKCEEYRVLLECAADLDEWDDKKFRKAAVEDQLVEATDVEQFDKEVHTALKRLTGGVARTLWTRRTLQRRRGSG